MWNPDELLAMAVDALRRESDRIEAEQAVHGLDALAELDFHPLLAAGFAPRHTVVREALYPGDVSRRAKAPERERCDLVVLPPGRSRLADPVRELAERDRATGTLFEAFATPVDPNAAAPDEAMWIEIKVIAQVAFVNGVPGPNRSWASGLTGAVTADLRKLSRERAIVSGAVLLVMFTADAAIATHDLNIALHRALDRGVAFRGSRTTTFAIADRIGNAACTLAWIERGISE